MQLHDLQLGQILNVYRTNQSAFFVHDKQIVNIVFLEDAQDIRS